jgi:hypothetical protein
MDWFQDSTSRHCPKGRDGHDQDWLTGSLCPLSSEQVVGESAAKLFIPSVSGCTVNINRILFLSLAASFPCGKSPTQTGGRCDPATNDQFVKLTPLGLIGAAAPREELPSVVRVRIKLSSCLLESIAQCA